MTLTVEESKDTIEQIIDNIPWAYQEVTVKIYCEPYAKNMMALTYKGLAVTPAMTESVIRNTETKPLFWVVTHIESGWEVASSNNPHWFTENQALYFLYLLTKFADWTKTFEGLSVYKTDKNFLKKLNRATLEAKKAKK